MTRLVLSSSTYGSYFASNARRAGVSNVVQPSATDEDTPMFDRDDTVAESTENIVYQRPLMEAVRAMLDHFGYRYQEAGDDNIALSIRGPKGLHSFFITAADARDYVRVIGSYGPAVPLERRGAVAEAISRANLSLGYGAFELDFSDGELRYRISVDMEGGLFAEKMADTMLGCSIHTLNRYSDAFYKVAFAEMEPEQAIRDWVA